MQVSAVGSYNSVNATSFKGRNKDDENILRLMQEDVDVIEPSFDRAKLAGKIQEAANFAREAAEYDASQDVSPVTIIAGAASLIGAAAFLKGKVLPPVRKTTMLVANFVSTNALKAFEKVSSLFKKSVDTSKVQGVVSEKLNKISENKEILGFKDNLLKLPTKIFGEDSKVTNGIKSILDNFKINSPIDVAETAIAGAVAYAVSDKVSDTTEDKIDGIKIGRKVGKAIEDCANAFI